MSERNRCGAVGNDGEAEGLDWHECAEEHSNAVRSPLIGERAPQSRHSELTATQLLQYYNVQKCVKTVFIMFWNRRVWNDVTLRLQWYIGLNDHADFSRTTQSSVEKKQVHLLQYPKTNERKSVFSQLIKIILQLHRIVAEQIHSLGKKS